MLKIARAIDAAAEHTGRAIAWAALAMVLIQFAIVVMRYVFGIGSIFAQESVVYLHGLLFMLGAAYALLHNAHVRVDIFYASASPRAKAWIDLAGVAVLLLPVCTVIFVYSWPYVVASWAVFEGSKETSGIPGVFLLKTVVLLFAASMILQGLAIALHAILVLTDREPPSAAKSHGGL